MLDVTTSPGGTPVRTPQGRDLTRQVTLEPPCQGMDRHVPLASGGSADIFLARWARDGQEIDVALKNYRLSMSDPEEIVEAVNRRLIRESEIWLRLENPHVQKYLGHYIGLGLTVALVSEFRKNGNILRYLKQNKDADKLGLVKEIASGLHYLHSNKIIHADLHCDNILIDGKGHALLTDFGRSKIIGASKYKTKLFVGSSQHMAPELRPPEELTEEQQDSLFCMSTDIYAFGMVCFEIFTGDTPFGSTPDYKLIPAVWKGIRPKRSPQTKQHISEEMWELMSQCWAQNPSQRPSAAKLVDILNSVE